jgi:endoglucanase
MRLTAALFAGVLVVAAAAIGGPALAATPGTVAAPQLHVSGNHLVSTGADGLSPAATVSLHGVNRSGAEFACVQGNGIFDGPVDDTATQAIADWGANAVRVPLNEDCWLGINGVDQQYSGDAYRQAIEGYVSTLESHGLNPILEMHWSDGTWTGNDSHCADAGADCQKPMPDAANAPAFWQSLGQTFGSDDAVVFDLFNEPYPNNLTVMDYEQSWKCWRDGGDACTGLTYQAAGMQDLVDAVRGTGAGNVILVGGNSYANDLSEWLTYEPTDPDDNLGASWHSYNFNYCADESCWDQQVAPVAAAVPLVATEIGENDCGHSYVDTLMPWLDSNGAAGFLAWTWNTWDCSSGPSLISDYNGTPTAYGEGVRAYLTGN